MKCNIQFHRNNGTQQQSKQNILYDNIYLAKRVWTCLSFKSVFYMKKFLYRRRWSLTQTKVSSTVQYTCGKTSGIKPKEASAIISLSPKVPKKYSSQAHPEQKPRLRQCVLLIIICCCSYFYDLKFIRGFFILLLPVIRL